MFMHHAVSYHILDRETFVTEFEFEACPQNRELTVLDCARPL